MTARRYLDYLAEIGRVGITLQYGTVGRPQHRYRSSHHPQEGAR